MALAQYHDQRLHEVQEQPGQAHTMTSELLAEAIAQAYRRFQAPSAKANVLRLIEAGGLTDATLALIELELPQWKLRRLVYDDGLWHCSLSKQLGLPPGLDETVDSSHEILPLAILSAFLEARCDVAASAARPKSVPQFRPQQGLAVCCENFS
jgi:hypothetical protein